MSLLSTLLCWHGLEVKGDKPDAGVGRALRRLPTQALAGTSIRMDSAKVERNIFWESKGKHVRLLRDRTALARENASGGAQQ